MCILDVDKNQGIEDTEQYDSKNLINCSQSVSEHQRSFSESLHSSDQIFLGTSSMQLTKEINIIPLDSLIYRSYLYITELKKNQIYKCVDTPVLPNQLQSMKEISQSTKNDLDSFGMFLIICRFKYLSKKIKVLKMQVFQNHRCKFIV